MATRRFNTAYRPMVGGLLLAALVVVVAWAIAYLASQSAVPGGALAPASLQSTAPDASTRLATHAAAVESRALLVALGAMLAFMALAVWAVVVQGRGWRRAEIRLRAVAHTLPGAVYVYRLKPGGAGSFDFLSINAANLFGLERDVLLKDARATRRAVLEEDRGKLTAAIARSAERLSELTVDFRVVLPDGNLRWIRSCSTPVREPAGDIVWTGYWFDITDSKTAERALRKAMQRLEDAHAVAGLGDWTCDLATGAATWSPYIHQMLRRDPSHAPRTWAEAMALFDDGARASEAPFYVVRNTRQPQDFELTARLPGGERLAVHVIAVPDVDPAGQVVGIHGTMQDISARKALEEHLFQAKEAADSANLAKSDFLATMSHEIRTPLNGILGMLELANLMRMDPELRSTLESIHESGKALQGIIDDILDFSKVEAGKLEIRPEPASIPKLVAAVYGNHASSASKRGLEFRCIVDPAISPAVMVDGLRLRQVLGNFVSNAIKFTPVGHVELRVRLLEREGCLEALRFEVEDTGIGIQPEQQAHLFERFEQAGGNIASRFGGTGLGLSIARRLARLMGGEVGMVSAPGAGTTMSLDLVVTTVDPRHLPVAGPWDLAPPPPAEQGVAQTPRARETPAGNGALVLVVDDHPVNRMVMRRQLNTLGYEVEDVEGAADALALWRSGRFALVLTDCNMPGISGYELSRSIRAEEATTGRPRIPIVACSANVISGVREDCIAAGMDDYLAKPTELMSMAAVMQRWLPLPGQQGAAAGVAAVAPAADASPAVDEGAHAQVVDPGLSPGVLAHFRRVNAQDVALLDDAVRKADMPQVVHMAHRIKGASGFIGARDLAARCAKLEQAGRGDRHDAMHALMADFHSELERLNAYLDA